MARAKIVPGVCVFLAASLTTGVAVSQTPPNVNPIRPRLLNCEPRMDKPDGTVLTKGYGGVGYHNTDKQINPDGSVT